MFDEIDTDKSGFIEEKELKPALVSIGINPSDEELKGFIE